MNRLKTISSHLNVTKEHLLLKESMVITHEVAAALKEGRPVVALESTIISHGMPYPQNVKTARAVEEVVRQNGAVPATIAILNGKIRIGLEQDDLELLGKAGLEVMKCSRRDLAYVISQKMHGATTVSGTMYLAAVAGIDVFVTGGIGGVHRGAQQSMDISTDLTELGRTRVAVVCAGVKSILDIPMTLEYLETQGVPVMTIGATEFPAFFTRHSGCTSQLTGTVSDAAALLYQQECLGLQTGVVVANPITPAAEAEAGLINTATTRALQMAEERRIHGKEITPFLLDKINTLSKGKSLEANIALVLNNAKVGAQLASEFAARKRA